MKTEKNNSLWLGWSPMYFNIFLYVFMSDILIDTPPYFLMWSISDHPVSARLAGLSDPRIPLLPLLSYPGIINIAHSASFFVGTGYLNSCSYYCKANNIHTETSLKPQWGSLLSLEDCFVFTERWFLFTFECWLHFSLFLLFSLKKRKTIYISFTFCFHFFLPACPSLLSSSFCKAILLGSHWVA